MLIELYFTASSGVNVQPEIAIYYNNKLKTSRVILDDCDLNSSVVKTKKVALNIDVNCTKHHIKIQSLNILNEYKVDADFGFQLRHVVADGVELGNYGIDYTCVNPAEKSYIKHFLEPAGRLHELEIINDNAMHVTRGYWANYVNLPNGWLEFEFQTPLYHWILNQQFGRQLSERHRTILFS